MLKQEDERAIEDLFTRLGNVERNSGPRDIDADRLIRQRLSENPSAAYFMAQTIIVQEAALREAQRRLDEQESRQEHGGFLGGIFGGDRPTQTAPRRGPWGRGPNQDQADDQRRAGTSGGFMAGAAQTALGVTGGLLLGGLITGLFTGDAQATEPEAPVEPEDPGIEDGGDMGDFDIGGDF